MENYIKLITLEGNRFKGQLVIDNQVRAETIAFPNKTNCIRAFNERVREYEYLKDLKLPRLKPNGDSVFFELVNGKYHIIKGIKGISNDIEKPENQPEQAVKIKQDFAKNEPEPTACSTPPFKKTQSNIQDNPTPQPSTEALQNKPSETVVQNNVQGKSRKPPRKPFTPYGLNGYLVDKKGNIRLMLDRRASASTIVLEPEMFNALAEMVRKTQEQNNAGLPRP